MSTILESGMEASTSERTQFFHQSARHESEGDKEHFSDSEVYITHQHERHDKRLKHGSDLNTKPHLEDENSFQFVFYLAHRCISWMQIVTKDRSSQTIVSFILGVVLGITLTALLFQHRFLIGGMETKKSEYFFNDVLQHTIPYEVRLKEINNMMGKDPIMEPEFGKGRGDYPVVKADSPKHVVEELPSEETVPKSINKEINFGSKVFVGVITAEIFLGSRAIAVNSTWGSQVDKLSFFTELGSAEKYGVPVINLEGVSDREYPPQKKAFKMLKHMCENHIDDYDWFIRADDDVYIRVEELKEFLGLIDSNKLIYMGQPGHGVPEVRDRLGLNGHNFCMGGPTVMFNRKALKKLCPHLDECMAEVVSGEEDVEIGRCVSNHLHIECTHAWETLKLFYHSYQEEYTEERPFLGNLAENVHLQKAITLHHVKVPYIMYKIHRHFTSLLLNSSTQEISYLRHQSKALNEHLPVFKHRQLSTVKIPPRPYKAEKINGVTSWKSFNVEAMFGLSYMTPSRDITNDCLADLKQIGETAIDVAIDHSATHLTYSHLAGGYYRTDPLRGTDYLLDISFSSKEEGKPNEVKRVHILRPLEDLKVSAIEEYDNKLETVNLYIILPIRESPSASGDLERYIRKYYEPTILQRAFGSQDSVNIIPTLIISMYNSKSNGISDAQDSITPSVQDVVNWFRVKYPDSKMEVFPKGNTGSQAEQNTYSHNIDFAYMQAVLHISRSRKEVTRSKEDNEKDVVLLSSMKFSLTKAMLDTCIERSSLITKEEKADSEQNGKHIQLYQPVPFALHPGKKLSDSNNIPEKDTGFWYQKGDEKNDLNMPICGSVANFISVVDNVQTVTSSFIKMLFKNIYDSKFMLQVIPDENVLLNDAR
ncbi:chondroitin sulfate synthase 1-like [Styela clava]